MAQEIADSTLLDTWGSGGNIVEPDISKIIEGWQLGEQPPHEYMNWLQNTFGSKLNHILKNGVVKWEPEKEFLAGATVQHNGNVWLCGTANTNSEPTDANANWKRIITVESLATVLGGYVALTDFTGTNRNLTGNGYQKLPGGLILQWGQVSNNNSLGTGFNTLVFPIAFPNGCFSITKMNMAAGGGGYSATDASFVEGAITASGATWVAYLTDNSISTTAGQVHINYIAIGR